MYVADWRSAADYVRHQHYDRAGFAWEIVRRNDDYGRDYERVGRMAPTDAAAADRFAQRWGLRFGADPTLDIEQQPIFWLPRALATTLQVQPARQDLTFDPLDLDQTFSDAARDGNDVIISRRSVRHHLHLDGYQGGAMAIVLPLDRLFERRVLAALRLWRALRGLNPGADPAPLSHYARDQLVLVIRLLDAEHSGASEREMARVVLNTLARTRREWIASEVRARLKRLLRRGHTLLEGGYLRLLNPPPRRPKI